MFNVIINFCLTLKARYPVLFLLSTSLFTLQHTSLLMKGILFTNLLQKIEKYLLNLIKSPILSHLALITIQFIHQRLINSWVAKALTTPYILCKISNFQSIIALYRVQIFRESSLCSALSIFSTSFAAD